MSFATFWSFLEELTTNPLPPQIDRSLMQSKSGTDQLNLTTALRAFDLVDENQAVTGLKALEGADEDQRIAWLGSEIRRRYPEQMRVSDANGTEQQLRDSFRQAFQLESSDTTRKSMTFFLHAARKAGIPLSPHFPATRSGSGAPGSPKSKRQGKRKPQSGSGTGGATSGRAAKPGDGDSYSVPLDSGGSVSVVVDVDLFQLSTSDRDFIIELIDKLKGYKTTDEAQEGSQ
jgi:hypothetical protein